MHITPAGFGEFIPQIGQRVRFAVGLAVLA